MKSKGVFPLAIAANVAPLGLCLLYRSGAPLLFSLFWTIHILLFLLNRAAAKTRLQVVLLGLIHIAVTVCTHRQVGWLYLHYVCDDTLGRAIIEMGTWVGAIWTSILFVASLVMFYRKQLQQKVEQQIS